MPSVKGTTEGPGSTQRCQPQHRHTVSVETEASDNFKLGEPRTLGAGQHHPRPSEPGSPLAEASLRSVDLLPLSLCPLHWELQWLSAKVQGTRPMPNPPSPSAPSSPTSSELPCHLLALPPPPVTGQPFPVSSGIAAPVLFTLQRNPILLVWMEAWVTLEFTALLPLQSSNPTYLRVSKHSWRSPCVSVHLHI